MIEPIAVYFEHCEPGWLVQEAVTPNAFLLLMTGGEIQYEVEGRLIRLRKGDFLHVPQGVVRRAENPSGTGKPHEMYVAHYRYQGNGNGLPLLQLGLTKHIKTLQYEYAKQRFSLLTQHWLRKHRYGAAFCHSILLELLALVNEEADAGSDQDKSYPIVSQLQNHIAQHYRRPIPMEELSRLVQRTPNHISRRFKESTGQTITEYTQQIRISAACDLLANSRMNVGEVSDFLGFCEQSYFNKVFKRLTGTLPSTYMQEKVNRLLYPPAPSPE